MSTKWHTVAGFVLALSLLLAPPAALADDAVADDVITEVKSEAEHIFAQQVTFTLQATANVEATRVYLFVQALGDEQTDSTEVPFEQEGDELSATYMRDLRLDPLPPFARVTFWWQVEYGANERYPIESQQFDYTDDRFDWEHLSDEDNNVTVHWIEGEGDVTFGQAALNIARISLQDINAELQAPLPESIDIYIYDAQHNLDAAMVLAGRDWVGGQAHPDLGVVVSAVPDNDSYASRMKRYIPHELTHLLVYQAVTPEGYRYVPDWLDEGLAAANEQLPNPDYALVLEEARVRGQLIPLKDLCVPFPPDAQIAYLSYAQSGSVVRFIRQQHGAPGIRALLEAYAKGASCESGVREALDVDLDGLETAWRASLGPGGPEPPQPWPPWVGQAGLWGGLWLLSLLVALPLAGRPRRR